MAAAPTARRSSAIARPARRSVLRFVARREADRRLSLVFGLLARSACADSKEGRVMPPGLSGHSRLVEASL
jgi:hypothetical protein